MQVVNQLDHELWKAFVDSHPQGNVFHTPEMYKVYAQANGHRPTLWATTTPGGEILALLLPVQITLFGGVFRGFTTRAVAYGSTLCAPHPEGKKGLALLLQTYRQEMKNKFLFTELRNLSDLTDVIPVLNQRGFAFENHLNFLIDLNRSREEIWKSIRSNARRNIQKAQRSEVEIVESGDRNDIPGAFKILQDVYKRIQVPLPDQSLFQAAFDVLYPQGMLQPLIAKVNGTDIGALFLLLYKDLVYYWYTGTLREFGSYRSGDLLVWHSLEYGNRKGYKLFDFGGGGKPEEEYGVREFKAKYGGTLVNFGRNVCVHAPLKYKLSQEGYQLVRQFL